MAPGALYGWVDVGAGLRIAYSNQKSFSTEPSNLNDPNCQNCQNVFENLFFCCAEADLTFYKSDFTDASPHVRNVFGAKLFEFWIPPMTIITAKKGLCWLQKVLESFCVWII